MRLEATKAEHDANASSLAFAAWYAKLLSCGFRASLATKLPAQMIGEQLPNEETLQKKIVLAKS